MNLTTSLRSSTEDTTLSMKSQVTCLSIPSTDQQMEDLTSKQWDTMEILEVVPFLLRVEKCISSESNLTVVQLNGIPLISTLVLEAIIMTGLKRIKAPSINELSLLIAVLMEAAEETVVVVMEAPEETVVVTVEVEMLVVSEHVQTQISAAMVRFSPTSMEMPVMNTPQTSQILGVETMTQLTSAQTQCAAHVVVAIVVMVDLIKATKTMKEVAIKVMTNRIKTDSALTRATA